MMGRYTKQRLASAQAKNARLKEERALARQILLIEGDNELMEAEIRSMEKVQRKLVQAEKKGIEKATKTAIEAARAHCLSAGAGRISGYLSSVKGRMQ